MKKRLAEVLSIAITALILVIAMVVVTAMDIRTDVKDSRVTNDLDKEDVDATNDLDEESGDVTASIDNSVGTHMLINRAPTNYMKMIGESYDVVLGEVIDSEKAIMTSSNYGQLDENGKANRIQKPYIVKVVKSYKGNIEEGKTVSVITSTLAMNDSKTNELLLKATNNSKDDYLSGEQYLFVLGADTKVIDRWGKNAYYLANIQSESIFTAEEDGKFRSNSFEIDLNAIADDIASAEKYISESPNYDKSKANISARKAAE